MSLPKLLCGSMAIIAALQQHDRVGLAACWNKPVPAKHALPGRTQGGTVFELTDATGRVFVMQSYSQQNDAVLAEADLANLGTRIKPPEGWVFGSRTLEDTLRVLAPNGDAVVIQDDLNNTYQLIASE